MQSAPPSPSSSFRSAATIVLIRDLGPDSLPTEPGLEVLLLRRADKNDHNGGAWVFPGGLVDASDGVTLLWLQAAGSCESWTVAHVAALRECFEECGMRLWSEAHHQPAEPEAWRDALNRGEKSLADYLQSHAAQVDEASVHRLSRWVTPVGMPKRFDTHFFIARAPAGQVVRVDGSETVEARWVRPAEPIKRGSAYKLLTPTQSTLAFLASCSSVEDALGKSPQLDAQTRDKPIMPRLGRDRKGTRPVTPDEPAYEELGKLDPEGRGEVACFIAPGVPVRLSPRVIRVTAPNASVMTGPGTNSYLVGGGASNRWAVIDPGPDEDAHLQALLAAAPGPIEWIFVTHTHRDHSPLAARLRAATGARCLGRLADHAVGQDSGFVPDQALRGGERIELPGTGATLDVIHTPGHASNHLCYRLVEDAMLFAGDQVMQRATVVINPPDGDMAQYLQSLRALSSLSSQPQVLDWIAPGHGFLMAHPQAVFDGVVAHRLQREDKLLQRMREAPAWDPTVLVGRVYDDVPVVIHGLALRSMAAHLLKLEQEGRIRRQVGVKDDVESATERGTLWALSAAS